MQALRILTKRAMRVNLLPNYEAFENQLMNQQVPITPAELQGILMGFYAAGMPLTQSNWLQQILQLVTNDDALELLLKEPLSGIQQQLKHELIDAQGSLTMLIHTLQTSSDESEITAAALDLAAACVELEGSDSLVGPAVPRLLSLIQHFGTILVLVLLCGSGTNQQKPLLLTLKVHQWQSNKAQLHL